MKKVIAITMSLLLCFALMACGETDDNSNNETAKTEPTTEKAVERTLSDPQLKLDDSTDPKSTQRVDSACRQLT